ncbi:MAG: hypothetical protein QNJ69_11080 [Gammaproteobacteria bacterium]|nr:hypothetical protein [Gammaproteobacteria bacterium]
MVPARTTFADPDPNAFNDHLKMLDAVNSGFRCYAARRQGFIDAPAAIPVVASRLLSEQHPDVRNEYT